MIKPDQGEIPQDLSQTDVITHTLRLLRKIRGFQESLWPEGLYLESLDPECHYPESLYIIAGPGYTPAQQRQFFLDAKRGGEVCAKLLIVPPDKPVVEEKNVWLEMMADLSTKYSNFPEITAMKSPLEEAAQRVGRTIRTLKILAPTIADSSTQKDFGRRFPFWYEDNLSLTRLCDKKRAIFSPLATDYLTACMLHRFIEIYVTPDCFSLRPVILNSRLRPAVMPEFIESLGWLKGIEEVGVFIENRNTGATGKATWEAVPISFYP